MPLNREDFEVNDAQYLRDELGPNLTPFVFAESLRNFDAQLRQTGVCVVLFSNHGRHLPALPEGFSFPAQWRRTNGAHDPGLPMCLHTTANQVLRVARAENTGWALHRLECHRYVDCSGLPLEGGSGFVPVAAALLLAQQDVASNPAVWSTGAWNNDAGCIAWVEVGGKGTAIACAGFADSVLYTPPNIDSHALGSIATRWLAPLPGKSVTEQLADLLSAADAAPSGDPQDSNVLQQWCAYMNRPHNIRRTRNAPVYARIAGPLGRDAYERGPTALLPARGEISRLVVAASLQATTAMLAIATWKPRAVHLLVSTEARKVGSEIKAFCREYYPDMEFIEETLVRDDKNMLDSPGIDLAKAMDDLLIQMSHQRPLAGPGGRNLIAVDVTSGTAAMSALLATAAHNARSVMGSCPILSVKTDYDRDINALKFGTECSVLLA